MQKALKILADYLNPDNESDIKSAIQLLGCFEDIKRDMMSNTCETIGVTVCEISDGLPYDMFQCKLSITRDESKFTEVYKPILPIELIGIEKRVPKVKVNRLYANMSITQLVEEHKALEYIKTSALYKERLLIEMLTDEIWNEISKKRDALLEQVDFSEWV
jgi:hypothetical protein